MRSAMKTTQTLTTQRETWRHTNETMQHAYQNNENDEKQWKQHKNKRGTPMKQLQTVAKNMKIMKNNEKQWEAQWKQHKH